LLSSEFTSVQFRLRDEELDALDAYRRDRKSSPSRARAVEQLFRRGLTDVSFGQGGQPCRSTVMVLRIASQTASSIAFHRPLWSKPIVVT
jgi:hypothetical protein